MESIRETEGDAKNKPWSASQSRSHRGEKALRVYVRVCVGRMNNSVYERPT